MVVVIRLGPSVRCELAGDLTHMYQCSATLYSMPWLANDLVLLQTAGGLSRLWLNKIIAYYFMNKLSYMMN
jgi:hypothetical protein